MELLAMEGGGGFLELMDNGMDHSEEGVLSILPTNVGKIVEKQ